jgi:hypothetical protein
MAATGACFDQKYRCRLNVLLARLPDQPNSRSFVINLQTARALGIEVRPDMLSVAADVIE